MRTACARRCRSSTSGRRPRRTWPRTSWTSGCSRPSTTSRPPRGPRGPRRSSSCTRRPGCPRPPAPPPDPRPHPRPPSRPREHPTRSRDRPGTPGLAMSGRTTTTVRVIRTCEGQQVTTTRTATKAEAARETGMRARRLQTLRPTRTEWTGVRHPHFCRDSTGLAATSGATEYHPGSPHRCRSQPTLTRRVATA